MKPSLDELQKRHEKFGDLGALPFLIALAQQGSLSEKIPVLRCTQERRTAKQRYKKLEFIRQKLETNLKRLSRVESLRVKLLSLGFTQEPLAELEQIYQDDPNISQRVSAARALALWHILEDQADSYQRALGYIRSLASKTRKYPKLTLLELFCLCKLQQHKEAHALFQYLQQHDLITADILLVMTNLATSSKDKVHYINQALQLENTSPITLINDTNLSLFDCLSIAKPADSIDTGPKVSVLVAAYNTTTSLKTALRSLQNQTWRNLEVIVLDDHSPDLTTYAIAQEFTARDSRFKAIRMPQNGGAYVARNYGLSISTGDLVTLHDADDWSHPEKIEMQVKTLLNSSNVACMSKQVRTREQLIYDRLTGSATITQKNFSSLMFRREAVVSKIGYWDTVRFGSDSEFITRLKLAFGECCIADVHQGIFSFVRLSDSSEVSNDYTGFHHKPHGVRKQYVDARTISHIDGNLHYDAKPAHRYFPVSRIQLLPRADGQKTLHYDVVLASDFRLPGGTTQSNIQELICQRRAGLKVALCPMFRYDTTPNRVINPHIFDLVDGENIDILAYGQNISCDLLIIRHPPVLYRYCRYLPKIYTKHIAVIVNQSPYSNYSDTSRRQVYDIKRCEKNLQSYFGKSAIWYPIGHQIRKALHDHHQADVDTIKLSDWDWTNIIDIQAWRRSSSLSGNTRLRVGRISRDSPLKWPNSAKDILAAYPDCDEVEVHILGGASAPRKLIGHIPTNWTVHAFGAMHPREFLETINIFVYFTSPDWVEAFGRVILEAMAAGVPVILSDIYEPLFQEAAIYATPQTAIERAQLLWADQAAYAEQIKCAHTFVQKHFSFEAHLYRLAKLGVKIDKKFLVKEG